MDKDLLDQLVKSYSIRGVVDRFEGKLAIIKTDDGQEISWPIKNLPEDCQEGSVIRLTLSTSKTDQEEREKIAKAILNEVLKNEKSD